MSSFLAACHTSIWLFGRDFDEVVEVVLSELLCLVLLLSAFRLMLEQRTSEERMGSIVVPVHHQQLPQRTAKVTPVAKHLRSCSPELEGIRMSLPSRDMACPSPYRPAHRRGSLQ